jgi:LPXTG-motif cell wall-anchored protein
MSRRWTTIFTLLALAFAPAVLAQSDHEVIGTVTAKDATTLTLTTEQNQTVSFQITEQSLLPETLSIGDKVSVHHLVSTGEGGLQPITEVLIADEVESLDGADSNVLPQTASPLAALVVIGMASMAGAAGLRRKRG